MKRSVGWNTLVCSLLDWVLRIDLVIYHDIPSDRHTKNYGTSSHFLELGKSRDLIVYQRVVAKSDGWLKLVETSILDQAIQYVWDHHNS